MDGDCSWFSLWRLGNHHFSQIRGAVIFYSLKNRFTRDVLPLVWTGLVQMFDENIGDFRKLTSFALSQFNNGYTFGERYVTGTRFLLSKARVGHVSCVKKLAIGKDLKS